MVVDQDGKMYATTNISNWLAGLVYLTPVFREFNQFDRLQSPPLYLRVGIMNKKTTTMVLTLVRSRSTNALDIFIVGLLVGFVTLITRNTSRKSMVPESTKARFCCQSGLV